MQRQYIQKMVKSIELMKLRRLKTIHICFITHSPFILSDIPESNVLFLDNGIPVRGAFGSENLKTFGANIYDLLANSFFLNEGAVGAFALNKINRLFESLKNARSVQLTPAEREEIRDVINLIGEQFLRDRLSDLYYAIFDKQRRIELLKDEIKRLENDSTANE